MQSMPKQFVFAAGGVMVLAAVVGAYTGVSHSLSARGGADETAAIVPVTAPIASAKPILTPAVTMDEAEVRRLAREEAKALITPKPALKKADADDDDDTSTPDQPQPISPTVPLAPAKAAVPLPQG